MSSIGDSEIYYILRFKYNLIEARVVIKRF